MNRDQRVAVAQQTLDILAQGLYRAPSGRQISVAAELRAAIDGSVLYRPSDFPNPIVGVPNTSTGKTQVEVTGETTLAAAERLAASHPLCLNFASAKNPGGGFLSGSQAQEESLARSSGLYACLAPMTEMYDYNRQIGTSLYSDYMIYSPNVPVFRRDDGLLREEPFCASFVTAPAVNAGAVVKNEPKNVAHIRSTLATRINKILWLAQEYHHTTLILGAWGCGVFGNEPTVIAELFADAFGPKGLFHSSFAQVVYAIYDTSQGQETKAAFAFLDTNCDAERANGTVTL